jgi:hypothetical protein
MADAGFSRSLPPLRPPSAFQEGSSDEDSSHLFVDSTISRDRTEGRKQGDEEALKSLPKGKSARTLAQRYHRRRFIASSSDSTTSGSAEPVTTEVAKAHSPQRSHSPIPWRQDLKLRRSVIPQSYDQGDRGLEGEGNMSETAAFNGLSEDMDEMRNDNSYEAMQKEVRL